MRWPMLVASAALALAPIALARGSKAQTEWGQQGLWRWGNEEKPWDFGKNSYSDYDKRSI